MAGAVYCGPGRASRCRTTTRPWPGYLARLSKQEGARLQYALAGLTAAGYNEKKLRQYIKQALNAQQMDEYTAAARESAAAHPVGTSLASTAANLVGGMGYLAALPRTAANTWAAATGNYDAYIPIDENANSFRATKYAQTVREEVARQLQEKYPDGEFLGRIRRRFSMTRACRCWTISRRS